MPIILLLFCVAIAAASSVRGAGGVGRTMSGEGPGQGWVELGLSMENSNDESRLVGSKFIHKDKNEQSNKATFTDVRDVFSNTFRASFGYGFTDFWDINIVLPYHQDDVITVDSVADPDIADISGSGLGDLEFLQRIEFPFDREKYPLEFAILTKLTVPTGTKKKGFIPKEQWIPLPDTATSPTLFSGNSVGFGGGIALTVDGDFWKRGNLLDIHINSLYHHLFIDGGYGAFFNSIAFEYQTEEYLSLYLELSSDNSIEKVQDLSDFAGSQLRISPGLVLAHRSLEFTFGIDYGLQIKKENDLKELWLDDDTRTTLGARTEYKTNVVSEWGFHSAVSWRGSVIRFDRDDDAIYDDIDICPEYPEDLDDYEDEDGCPEVDNDQDGLDDDEDYCPNIPEDRDGFEDEDGCPDDDDDGDGVPDLLDLCPKEKEDFNSFKDDDGCPDGNKDEDRDGIADHLDRCPASAEDFDGLGDEDGCPESDFDRDRLADEVDECPAEAEVYNSFQDQDGCPDKIEKVFAFDAGNVLKNVNFQSGSSVLTEASFEELEKVADILMSNPLVQVEVSGHTDAYGSLTANMELSEERAETVVEYLINQGVAEQQLLSNGYGPEKPIESNATHKGRALNRRIEIRRLR